MAGEQIEFKNGIGDTTGYLARPSSGSGPGVIVLQEWWGLVPHIKDVADRFAAEGFTALAPDLYFGKSTQEPDEAESMLQALNIGDTEKLLAKCVGFMLSDSSVTPSDKVGVVGFCMGGQLAMFAAGVNPAIRATVDFYGIHPNVHPAFENIQGGILGIFAEHDDYGSPAAVAALSAKLDELGKPHEFVTYPGVNHAFFNDTRPTVYNAEAAHDAWRRTIEFLKAELA